MLFAEFGAGHRCGANCTLEYRQPEAIDTMPYKFLMGFAMDNELTLQPECLEKRQEPGPTPLP